MGRNIIDATGQKFGLLVVLKIDHVDPKKGAYWLCRCECGKFHVANGGNLRARAVKSCGCLVAKTNHQRRHKCRPRLAAPIDPRTLDEMW
jgi:hypothetical protein